MTLWPFRKAQAEGAERPAARESLRIEPAFLTNDGSTARYWAEQDLGFVLRSEWDVADSLARGALVRVLDQWQFDDAPVMLLVPTREGRSARVQAFLQFCEETLGAN